VTQFLLQLAGVPGSGKSALARLIGARTGAVVIDKDVLKSAALDAGIDESLAGGVSYETFFALADHVLGQGHSAILDSPSFYASIPANGFSVAQRRCVPYHFIECACPDSAELARRLRERPRLRSNPTEPVEERETFSPPGPYLRIDTTEPIERCLAIALEYLGLE
jgi:predicted kinase